jgi:hypothetical protein
MAPVGTYDKQIILLIYSDNKIDKNEASKSYFYSNCCTYFVTVLQNKRVATIS